MSTLSGVSLPYFFGNYGHDLAPNALTGLGPRHVDPMQIYRPLLKAHELGYRAVRIWLCEGAEGILMNDGIISGVHPVLVESLAVIQESASLCGLRLYWTLLDGHSCTHDRVSHAVLTERDQTARFAELVAAPLARRFDARLTIAVEVVNEPEALITREAVGNRESAQWRGCGIAIKTIANAIRSARPGTLVTAGSARPTLPMLWGNVPGLDAIDVHVKARLPLPSRTEIVKELSIPAARAASLPMIAGYRGDMTLLTHHADYSAVFRWRLEQDQ